MKELDEKIIQKESQEEWEKIFSGKHLKALRDVFEISQEFLAVTLGIDQPDLAEMEEGSKPMPFEIVRWLASNASYLPKKMMPSNA